MKRLTLLALSIVILAQSGFAANQKGVNIPALPAAAPIVNVTVPALSAPKIQTPGVTAVPGTTAVPGIAGVAQGVAPHIEAIAQPQASETGSAQAAQSIETILQGGKASEQSGVTAALGTVETPGGSASSGLTPATPSANAPKAEPQAPKGPEGPKSVDSRVEYNVRRIGLAWVARKFGIVNSLPPAGKKLTASILKRAAYKDAVLSDIDDTLGKYNTVLEKETVDAIVAVRAAGKTFAAITDRPDFARPGSSQMGAMDTFSSVPQDQRQGLIVATNGGGKIYEYDVEGNPRLIYEEPNLPDNERAIVKESAAIVTGKLAEMGTALQTQDPKDPSKTMEPLNHGPYGFSMILKAGTPETVVKQVAHVMETEMKARGLGYEVEGRMAKDPTLPPYITFSKLNKSLAVKRIAAIKKLEAERTILIGDSMYKPESPKVLSPEAQRALKWSEKLAGRTLPLTGNATDRNMELGMPGAMTLSVGGTADPRLADGWVLDHKNAEGTRLVLRAVASTKLGADSALARAGHIMLLLGLVGMGLAGWFMFYAALTGVLSAGPAVDPNIPPGMPIPDINDLFR